MAIKNLGKKELEYLIIGATIFGTGGGGDPEEGLKTLLKDLEEGRKISIIDPKDVKDDALTVCAYFAGTIAPPSKEVLEKISKLPRISESPVVAAVRLLEEYVGEKSQAILPAEIGGGNTAEALHVAALLGLPAIDGDLCGRSLPEIVQSTYYVFGIPITPLSVVDPFGNSLIITKIIDDTYVDTIVRPITVAAGGHVGVADHPVKGEVMKKTIVTNTLTKSIELGKAVTEAVKRGEDPIEAIIKFTDGFLLFKGIVKSNEWEDKEGFMYGTSTIEGIDEYSGSTMKIWYKNENLMAWRDGKVVATCPDLICVVDSETGHGITNDKLSKGMKVTVIGIKAPEVWRTEKGLKVLSPKYFGFKEEYIPIEKLQK